MLCGFHRNHCILEKFQSKDKQKFTILTQSRVKKQKNNFHHKEKTKTPWMSIQEGVQPFFEKRAKQHLSLFYSTMKKKHDSIWIQFESLKVPIYAGQQPAIINGVTLSL